MQPATFGRLVAHDERAQDSVADIGLPNM